MDISELIGWVGFSASMMVGPAQLFKTIKMKDARGVSATTYGFLLIACSAYLVRAIFIKEWVFIFSNLFGVLSTSAMLYLIFKYRKRGENINKKWKG